jgi:hypothetical protein
MPEADIRITIPMSTYLCPQLLYAVALIEAPKASAVGASPVVSKEPPAAKIGCCCQYSVLNSQSRRWSFPGMPSMPRTGANGAISQIPRQDALDGRRRARLRHIYLAAAVCSPALPA